MSEFVIDGNRINGVVHLSNGHSTNAKQMVRETERIAEYLPYLDHKYVKTSEDRSATIDHLQEVTEVDDLVVIYGGEATVNIAAEAYLHNQYLSSVAVPHLIRPGGNKNDLYHSLYKGVFKKPVEALKSSHPTNINPIEFLIESEDGEIVINEFAVSYGGLGAVAKASKLLNERRDGLFNQIMRSNRLTRFVLESYSTLEGLLTAEQFSFIDHNDSDRQSSLVELSYVNGRRMAGGLLTTLVEPDNELAVKLEERTRFDLIVDLIGQVIASGGGSIVERVRDDIKLTSPAILHLDAEGRELPANTRVQINRSAKSFPVLTNW
jgi:hypothetical protein